MKGFLLFLFAAALVLFTEATAAPADSSPLAKTIEHLLQTVEKSPCTFVRNGSNHTGKEAAKHMRRKYNYFRKDIRTAQQFIDKCATKSELTGKLYYVKCSDGKVTRCDDWLKNVLKEAEPAKP